MAAWLEVLDHYYHSFSSFRCCARRSPDRFAQTSRMLRESMTDLLLRLVMVAVEHNSVRWKKGFGKVERRCWMWVAKEGCMASAVERAAGLVLASPCSHSLSC